MLKKVTVEQLDALLPQTQCGLCTYAGCKPYATAIIENDEQIDKCLPGGIRVLKKIGQLMRVETTHLYEAMQQKHKSPAKVKIQEDLCIGCMKCIKACPVDAIIGSAKWMHTVIESECTGCELCIEPCPMDCIEIVPGEEHVSDEAFYLDAQKAKARFNRREARLKNQENTQRKAFKQAVQPVNENLVHETRKNYILEALMFEKNKKASK